MIEKELSFHSAGLKLAATLYAPDAAAERKHPAVVLCHGLRCNRKIVLPDFAKGFVGEGYVALAFDYRGFGESEGTKHRLIARERVEDVVAATTFLGLQPEVDDARIALFGISYGAANAISAAAIDPRPRAVIAQGGFGDGDRWLRVGRSLYDYWELRKRLDEDRKRRVLTGESEHVDPFEMVPPTPAEQAYRSGGPTQALSMTMPLEMADDLRTYRPELDAAAISPRALCVIGAELDFIVDVEESRRIYEKAKEPKRLHILPGLSHTEPYSKGLPDVVRLSAEFLRETMP
jgi:pimeloyl-ACP methyl ester carboxylesterase